MGQEIINRASIDEIDGHRRQALALYEEAFDLLAQAGRTAGSAAPSGVYDLPKLTGQGHSYGFSSRDDFRTYVRREVDRAVWSHLLIATNLDKLMDATAKEQFRAQIKDDPPEATAENCYATLSRLVEDRELIFKRGLATAFSKLDRRFRSHDGFKIGARLVFSYFADKDGYFSHHGRTHDSIMDVERVFSLLDHKPQPERHAGIIGALDAAHRAVTGSGFGAAQYAAETDYFRAKVFKNGHAHLWFKRDDLVQQVNELLADYYGAALGVGADAAPQRHAYASTPAKNFGFFQSPPAVVRKIREQASIYSPDEVSRWTDYRDRLRGMRVLEPSAGLGAIAAEVADLGCAVTCAEIQEAHAQRLRLSGKYARVICADFLELSPAVLGQFDAVLMNPPFDRGRDIDHVTHALRFVKPGGVLVAVMSAGVEFREDGKTADFRAMVERLAGRFEDLPERSFAEAGTNVNTCVLTLRTR